MEQFERHVAELEAEEGSSQPAPEREPGEPREVVIGDPVDPEREPAEDQDEPGTPSRRARKANRYKELETEKVRLETEARMLREELERRNQQPAPVQYQPPQQQGPDPIAVAEANLRREYGELHEVYSVKANAGTLTKEEAESFRARGWELQNKTQLLNTAKAFRAAGLTPEVLARLKNGGGQANGTGESVQQQIYRTEFPDIYRDPKLVARAQHEYQGLLLEGKDPDDINTGREALEIARRKYGTPQRPAPGRSERQQLSSLPSRGAGVSRDNGSGGGGSLKMDKVMIQMAVHTYPKLTRQQAIQKWANEIGPGLLEDERQNGR